MHFLIQEAKGGLAVWSYEFTNLRIPKVFNLRSDPLERADESALPFDTSQQLYFIAPGQFVVAQWLETFKEFPPRQRPVSFNVDATVQKLSASPGGTQVPAGVS